MNTNDQIEVKDLIPILHSLGFSCKPTATHLSSGGYYLTSNTNITVRPPRGGGYSSSITSVVFEADRSRGYRGRYTSNSKLTVHARDFHKLMWKFNAWLPGALAISNEYHQRQADLQEMNRLARAAVKNYAEAVGTDVYRVTTDAKGMPVGIKIDVNISGATPGEVLRKHSALRKLPEILALLERTVAQLAGESLPLPVRIRQEISDLLTSLNK